MRCNYVCDLPAYYTVIYPPETGCVVGEKVKGENKADPKEFKIEFVRNKDAAKCMRVNGKEICEEMTFVVMIKTIGYTPTRIKLNEGSGYVEYQGSGGILGVYFENNRIHYIAFFRW